MKITYTNEEVKEIVEAHRDGETLEELETRMAGQWIEHCRREGKDPAQVIKEAIASLRGTKRD
ncbi:hypothetical protein MYE70_10470 [Marinobacter alexandrii]|uniref:hypothetical protein n=1 Tax=Marinobacter alexandrii TaxID=2570351 RepID=UPI00110A0322|nr:hypothetical protein [Marinobacter alexandrii]MCK2149490.1 hypothetical protein [Marinobacter alexandrii]